MSDQVRPGLRRDYEMDYVREREDGRADFAQVSIEASHDGDHAVVTVAATGPGVGEDYERSVDYFGRFAVSAALRQAALRHLDMIEDGFKVDGEFREALDQADEADEDEGDQELLLEPDCSNCDEENCPQRRDQFVCGPDEETAAFLRAWVDDPEAS